jgi:asparagine synthase (glutamine-hydrolysing)
VKPTVPIYLYSKFKPFKVQSGIFEVYLQGTPSLMKKTNGTGSWQEEIINLLVRNDFKAELFLAGELKKNSGLFSLIVKANNDFIMASDIIRSFPVFYGFHMGKLFITDQLEEFQKENGNLELDYNKLEEFCTIGLTLGKETVYKNVYGLQAGEIVTIHNNEIRSVRYFEFKPDINPVHYKTLAEFTKVFNSLFLLVFSRAVEQHPNVNRWVVPLSGGHDSRLVVNYLHRLGVKNVICYSYGIAGNRQSLISKQVAQAVGYDWYFVEYTKQKWQALHESGIFGEYVDYSFNGVSTPHFQDFLAVYELKANDIIKDGDVFLPGHTVVTETVFDENTMKIKTVEEALQYAYSKSQILSVLSQLRNSIHLALRDMYFESKTSPENFMAFFDWQERQAKYITNSIKAYEFFGFRSLQPMWDMEIVDFWLKMPARERVGREALFETEKQGGLVKQLAQIPFVNEKKGSIRNWFTARLNKILPTWICVMLLRLTRSKVRLNEGLNLMYAAKAKSVKELLDPIEDFPEQIVPCFRNWIHRFPYQMDYNILTTLYTVRKQLDKKKANLILSTVPGEEVNQQQLR